MIKSVENVPTALYRFYDADDRLLYVGITHDVEQRWASHKRNQLWWLDVARKEHVWLPNRAEAEQAENRAITLEKPLRDRTRAPHRGIMTTWYDNPRADPYEEEQVANAARAITAAMERGDLPPWSILPVVDALAEQLTLSVKAADLGRRRLSYGQDAVLTHSRHHFITARKADFPTSTAAQHGELFVLADHHFRQAAFTTQQLSEKSRLSPVTVSRALSTMHSDGLVSKRAGRPNVFRISEARSDA